MSGLLISWIGATDLRAAQGQESAGFGPVSQAATQMGFKEIALLSDYPAEQTTSFVSWLREHTASPVTLRQVSLSRPTDFEAIYRAATTHISHLLEQHGKNTPLTFHLSPGTPHMAAVWIILAKTKYPAQLIESSREGGVVTTSFPFDLAAEFIPDLLKQSDAALVQAASGLAHTESSFKDIIYRSSEMDHVIRRARKIALRSIPVLIEGESGTGKELLARAIHAGSTRKDNPFVAINCGAIAAELIESELFGHEKGAFTGAVEQRKGSFESAHMGTLFLDEIGEMPKQAQVKLLRVLQENEIVRLGSSKPVAVDVRIIAATNRNLIEEVAKGSFREDLFFRLAVAVLKLPPLRHRSGDLSLLIDRLMETVNQRSAGEPGYQHKKISASAKNILIQHAWPGNVRELLNTLTRAVVWSDDEIISGEEVAEALLPMPTSAATGENILNRPLDQGITLPEIIKTVAAHYLERGLVETRGNKTKTAELLGLPSYQTLTNWLRKYGLE